MQFHFRLIQAIGGSVHDKSQSDLTETTGPYTNIHFQRPDCNFWSWSPPSFATDQRLRCELKSSDSGRASPSGKISGPKSCSGLSSIENGKDKIFLLVSFTLPGAPLQLPSNYKAQYAQVNDKIRRRHLSKHNLNYFCM